MTRIFFALLYIFILIGCKTKENDVSDKYFEGVNSKYFDEIKECLHQSILYVDGDYVVANSIESYYIFFQWDSVFSPEYKVLDKKILNDSVMEFIVSKTCKRIKFLHDTPTKYKFQIQTSNNKIVKLNIKENIVFDYKKWQKRRDTLTAFVRENYPELNGFEMDITKKGAENFLKAIDLFKQRKD